MAPTVMALSATLKFGHRPTDTKSTTYPSRIRSVRLPIAPPASKPMPNDCQAGGEAVRLTAKEFDLLAFLAASPRHVFSRDQLMRRVWGYEAAVDTGTVTVHVRRLRAKLEHDPAAPRHLETVWGVGYRFVP